MRHRKTNRARTSGSKVRPHAALNEPLTLYGKHPIAELLKARPNQVLCLGLVEHGGAEPPDAALSSILKLAQAHGIKTEQVSRQEAERLSQGAPHQGVLAQLRPFSYVDLLPWVDALNDAPLIVALDHIQDPHNLGAIARSALALGARGLVIPQDRSAQVTSSAYKASAGALAHLPVAKVVNLARSLTQLSDRGFQVVGTHLSAPRAPEQLNWRLATVLVVGNEQTGLRPSTQQRCHDSVRIPIDTIGSLNASVAGAICLYEARRQRLDLQGG